MEKIDSYGVDLDYIEEISPFELIGTFVKRDELEEMKNFLTYDEKNKLSNTTKTFEQCSKILQRNQGSLSISESQAVKSLVVEY